MATDTPVTPTATPAAPAPQPDEGLLRELATSAGLDPEAIVATAKAIRQHPWQVAKEVGSAQAGEFVDAGHHLRDTALSALNGVASAITNPEAKATAIARLKSPGLINKIQGAEEYATAAVPLVGGNYVKAEEQAGRGNIAGSIGTTLGTTLPLVTDTEGAEGIKAHLAETGKTFVDSAKEGLQRAAVATAPEGSAEAGFAKIPGSKKVRGATPKPTTTPETDPATAQVIQNAKNTPGYVTKPKGTFSASDVGSAWGPFLLSDGSLLYKDDSGATEDTHPTVLNEIDGLQDTNPIRLSGSAGFEISTRPTEPQRQEMARLIKETEQEAAETPTRLHTPAYWDLHTDHGFRPGSGSVGDFLRDLDTHFPNQPEPTEDKLAAVPGAKFVGKTPEPPAPAEPPATAAGEAPEYHPDLQKVIDLPGVKVHTDPKQVTEAAHFVTPDGKFIRLPAGLDHDGAILKTYAENAENVPADVRPKFMSETGAIRIRPTVDKGGPTLHVSVPTEGVTPEQVDALKQAVGQGLGRYGHMMLENTVPAMKDLKTEYKEFVKPSDVEPMLKKIEAHPDQAKAAEAPTDEHTFSHKTFGVDDSVGRIDAHNATGEAVGHVTYNLPAPNKRIGDFNATVAMAAVDEPGKGLGQKLYLETAAQAKAKGARYLVSDTTHGVDPSAVRVWDKLIEKGYPVEKLGKTKYRMDLSKLSEAAAETPKEVAPNSDVQASAQKGLGKGLKKK